MSFIGLWPDSLAARVVNGPPRLSNATAPEPAKMPPAMPDPRLVRRGELPR